MPSRVLDIYGAERFPAPRHFPLCDMPTPTEIQSLQILLGINRGK